MYNTGEELRTKVDRTCAAQERTSRTAARCPRSARTDTPRRAPPRTAAPGKDIKCSSCTGRGILCVSAAQKYQHTRAQKGITRKSATQASRASSLRMCLSKCAHTPTPCSRAPRPRAPVALRLPRTRALRMPRLRTPCHLHRMQHALPPRQRLPPAHAPRACTAYPRTHTTRLPHPSPPREPYEHRGRARVVQPILPPRSFAVTRSAGARAPTRCACRAPTTRGT
jgi:hypothetical protein